jgi:hypothetical protein
MIRMWSWVFVLGLWACGTTTETPASSDGAAPPGDATLPPDPGPEGPISGLFDGLRVNFLDQLGGVYSAKEDDTNMSGDTLRDASTAGRVVKISFPGKVPGTFRCGDDGGALTSIRFTEPRGTYSTLGAADLTPCAIAVTQYGAVGAHIVGTFSGLLILTSGSTGSPKQVTVTDGKFDVLRLMDQ